MRETAVVLHHEGRRGDPNMYGVRVRRRVLGLWWGSWRKVLANDHVGFSREVADELAAQALANGWVETYGGYAEPLIGKESEEP